VLIAIVLALVTLVLVGALAVTAVILSRATRGHQFDTALRAEAEVEFLRHPGRTYAAPRAA
jgi:hypothetical protein